MFSEINRGWGPVAVLCAALALSACENASDTPAINNDPTQTGAVDPNASNVLTGNQLGQDSSAFPVDVGNTILFATDAHDLGGEAQAILQRQAQWLLQHPAVMATIEGHADERGTREYNLALGERRANAVAGYLVALGVDAARLQTISYGKEHPLCVEADEACWQGNRRGVTALNP